MHTGCDVALMSIRVSDQYVQTRFQSLGALACTLQVAGAVLPHNRNCDFELQNLIAAVSSCHLCIRDPKIQNKSENGGGWSGEEEWDPCAGG